MPPLKRGVRYRAAVTFESLTAAPETYRTELVAGSHQKAASRAMIEAKRAYPGRRPCSIVILLDLGERDVSV